MANSQTEDSTLDERMDADAAKGIDEGEVRAQIVESLGLDEIDHAELIDKLVSKEVEHLKTKASLTKQKAHWRDKATNPVATPTKQDLDAEALLAKAEAKVREEFEKRDLAEMDFADDLKKEVQNIAKIKGISIKQASQDPYIAYLKTTHAEQEKKEEASVSRTKQSPTTATKFTMKQPDVDASTPEGRQVLGDWMEWMSKQ